MSMHTLEMGVGTILKRKRLPNKKQGSKAFSEKRQQRG